MAEASSEVDRAQRETFARQVMDDRREIAGLSRLLELARAPHANAVHVQEEARREAEALLDDVQRIEARLK